MGAEDTYVSGSGLGLVDKCAGSAALPRVGHTSEAADAGSAFHEHGRDRTLMTQGDAQARVAEHAEAWGLGEVAASILATRARAWDWQPPPGTLSEVALGLMDDGRVERVTGGRGVYQGPPGMRVATRVDFFWAEPEPLTLGADDVPRCPHGSLLYGMDLKTGSETWVDPVEHNLQALCAAILPAIWTGARSCVPAIVYPGKGEGVWDVPKTGPLDRAGIERGRDLLLAVAARANVQRDRYRQGLPLALTTGAHCTWCDAATRCPALLGEIKGYLLNPRPFEGVELTHDESVRLAELLPSFKRFTASVEGALKRRVLAHGAPIPIGDGTVYGPETKPTKTIDPGIAYRALVAHVGEERAREALSVEVSETAIRAAVKALHDATGVDRQGAATVRAIFRDIRAQEGGITMKPKTTWHRWRPPVVEPPALPEATTIDASVEIDGDPE